MFLNSWEKYVRIEDVVPNFLCLMENLPNVIQKVTTPVVRNGDIAVRTQTIVNVRNVWITDEMIYQVLT